MKSTTTAASAAYGVAAVAIFTAVVELGFVTTKSPAFAVLVLAIFLPFAFLADALDVGQRNAANKVAFSGGVLVAMLIYFLAHRLL